MKKLALLIFVLLAMGGCAVTEPTKSNEMKPDNPKRQICREPRPEMCTQQYDPVCGQFSRGGSQTYSNWCSACSDKAVESYVPGECR
jgi:hypothetical protein